jgi:hypothetical protein
VGVGGGGVASSGHGPSKSPWSRCDCTASSDTSIVFIALPVTWQITTRSAFARTGRLPYSTADASTAQARTTAEDSRSARLIGVAQSLRNGRALQPTRRPRAIPGAKCPPTICERSSSQEQAHPLAARLPENISPKHAAPRPGTRPSGRLADASGCPLVWKRTRGSFGHFHSLGHLRRHRCGGESAVTRSAAPP